VPDPLGPAVRESERKPERVAERLPERHTRTDAGPHGGAHRDAGTDGATHGRPDARADRHTGADPDARAFVLIGPLRDGDPMAAVTGVCDLLRERTGAAAGEHGDGGCERRQSCDGACGDE
jgi:hypothetical protein